MPLSLVYDCTRVESHLESKNSMLTTIPQSSWSFSLYLHQRLWVKFSIDTMVPSDIVKFPNSTRSLTSTVVQCRLQTISCATLNASVHSLCIPQYRCRRFLIFRGWKVILKTHGVSSCIYIKLFIDAMVPTDTLKCRWVLDFQNSTRYHSTSTVQCRQSLVQLSTLRLSHVPFSSLTMNTAMPLSLVPDCVLDSLAVISPSIHLTTLF